MRNFKTIVAVVFAAFLVLWAMAPAVHASNVSSQSIHPQPSFQGDEDDDGNGDDDTISVPVYWSPQIAFGIPGQGSQQLLSQGSVKSVPGLASLAAMASSGVLVIANGPSGPLAIPAPPYDRSMNWGSFGTHQNWANAFMTAHGGKAPTLTDEIDFWASQAYAAETGVSPFSAPIGFEQVPAR